MKDFENAASEMKCSERDDRDDPARHDRSPQGRQADFQPSGRLSKNLKPSLLKKMGGNKGFPDTAAFFEAGLLTAAGRFIVNISSKVQL